MLRYIKHNLTTIDGIEIYPIISLLIFFLFFAGLIWWVIKVDKKYVSDMSNYPLHNEEDEELQL